MTEDNGTIAFLATIPTKANAISIDGEDRAGGRLVLDIPGTDLAPLLRLTTVRGRVLLITVAPQQSELPLTPVPPDVEDPLFPKAAAVQPSVSEQVTYVLGPGEGVAGNLRVHIHRFRNDICLDCGTKRDEAVDGKAQRPRKVRPGTLALAGGKRRKPR